VDAGSVVALVGEALAPPQPTPTIPNVTTDASAPIELFRFLNM
jgi:hypothetical protein